MPEAMHRPKVFGQACVLFDRIDTGLTTHAPPPTTAREYIRAFHVFVFCPFDLESWSRMVFQHPTSHRVERDTLIMHARARWKVSVGSVKRYGSGHR